MKLISVRTTTIELDETERLRLGTIIDFWNDHHAGEDRREPEVSSFANTIYGHLLGTR